MSPVSRGRSKKNRSAKGPRNRRSPARALPADTVRDTLTDLARSLPGGVGLMAQARAWWPASHAEVLAGAAVLVDSTAPGELEEAVCTLIGDHWRRMQEEHSTGFAPSGWLERLITAAEPRAEEPAVRRLLRGIATIAAPGLAADALGLLQDTRSDVTAAAGPAWLDTPPAVTASPAVLLLRDLYGLRFGLLAPMTTDDGPARTYLFDIDLCYGFDRVVRCGYHPEVAAASAAWRSAVGASADHAEPEPLPDGLLPHLLTGSVFDGPFATTPTGDSFRELFRADRVAHEIFDALDRAGRPVSWREDAAERAGELADALTGQFRTWAAGHDVDLPVAQTPDDDVVRWLLGSWISPGLTEQLALAVSPHRIAAFTAYLNDDWKPEDRGRALAVLPSWVRYCLERSGVTGPAAEHSLAWAERAVQDPDAVGNGHGDNLGVSVDETTVALRPDR